MAMPMSLPIFFFSLLSRTSLFSFLQGSFGSSQTWLFQTWLFAIFTRKRSFCALLRPFALFCRLGTAESSFLCFLCIVPFIPQDFTGCECGANLSGFEALANF